MSNSGSRVTSAGRAALLAPAVYLFICLLRAEQGAEWGEGAVFTLFRDICCLQQLASQAELRGGWLFSVPCKYYDFEDRGGAPGTSRRLQGLSSA